MLVPLLVVAAMLAANGFFVASEFAAVGVRRSRVHARAEAGLRSARRLQGVISDGRRLDSYIATCQIGITLSSLLLGAYGQIAFTPLLHVAVPGLGLAGAAAAVLVALTTLQVVLGELVPKSLALQFPTRTALASVWLTEASRRLFTPLIWLLNGSAWGALRLVGVRAGAPRHLHDPEELEMMVAESGREGVLEEDLQQRLRGALRLRRTTAKDVMVPRKRVYSVGVDSLLANVAPGILESSYTRIPVVDDGAFVGLLHTKDVLLGRGRGDRVRDLMRPIPRVDPDMPGDAVIVALRDARAQMAAVSGLGIITFEDVLADMLGVPHG